MNTYQIKQIDFLTQMPANNFEGDSTINSTLQQKWQGEQITCQQDVDSHLHEILEFIEDNCGMLVGHVIVECVAGENSVSPISETYMLPSLTGRYPAGWVWQRTVTLVK